MFFHEDFLGLIKIEKKSNPQKGLHMLLNDAPQLIGRYYARLTPFYFSLFKDKQRRHALHFIMTGCLRVAIDVNFNDGCFFAELMFDLLEYGRHHFARAAP